MALNCTLERAVSKVRGRRLATGELRPADILYAPELAVVLLHPDLHHHLLPLATVCGGGKRLARGRAGGAPATNALLSALPGGSRHAFSARATGSAHTLPLHPSGLKQAGERRVWLSDGRTDSSSAFSARAFGLYHRVTTTAHLPPSYHARILPLRAHYRATHYRTHTRSTPICSCPMACRPLPHTYARAALHTTALPAAATSLPGYHLLTPLPCSYA